LKLDEIEEVQREVAELLAREEAGARGELLPAKDGEDETTGEEDVANGEPESGLKDGLGESTEPVAKNNEAPSKEDGDQTATPED
ncbi:MAG: hypothetical protein CMO61_11035, partial [Verrucomicrobiales bacterium]|nr:hypothetical protein [Verrucomicrobiales bacterium]